MKQKIIEAIQAACKELSGQAVEVVLTRPDEQFGDYSTNVALHMGGNPREIAGELVSKLQGGLKGVVTKIEVAGPGFINFTLTDEALKSLIETKPEQFLKGKTIVIEHTDPNPFKEFHIGHAYSNTVGESIGRLLGAAGAKVHQVSYHGDAGLHIAMAIWGMKQQGRKLDAIPPETRHEFLAKSYALGSKANKEDEKAVEEIKAINKQVYARDDAEINELYDTGRQWSFAYFDSIYDKLGVRFEKQYFETETGKIGAQVVKENSKVFEESDGAVIYDGEKKGLHKRVFITREGLPTYEAKELGLAHGKAKDYPNAEKFIVITANEINEYFKVLIAALGEVDKTLASKITHLSHGMVKLPSGKMSSRTGDVITLSQVLEMLEDGVKKLAKEATPAAEDNVLGALKYAFLKHRLGGDIIFDIEESISLHGNSGPYLQYAFARANSILGKAQVASNKEEVLSYEDGERSLARKLGEYSEVVESAVHELAPSHICTYLYELAQTFNRFYENNRVLGDERESVRLSLVSKYAAVLKNGLELLNIPAPEKM